MVVVVVVVGGGGGKNPTCMASIAFRCTPLCCSRVSCHSRSSCVRVAMVCDCRTTCAAPSGQENTERGGGGGEGGGGLQKHIFKKCTAHCTHRAALLTHETSHSNHPGYHQSASCGFIFPLQSPCESARGRLRGAKCSADAGSHTSSSDSDTRACRMDRALECSSATSDTQACQSVGWKRDGHRGALAGVDFGVESGTVPTKQQVAPPPPPPHPTAHRHPSSP